MASGTAPPPSSCACRPRAPCPCPTGSRSTKALAWACRRMTACHSLMLAAPLDGEAVIVTGAAGGVCNYAVQLAKAMGARVLAVVRGSDEREEDARRAGADLVVNTDREDLAQGGAGLHRGRRARAAWSMSTSARISTSPGASPPRTARSPASARRRTPGRCSTGRSSCTATSPSAAWRSSRCPRRPSWRPSGFVQKCLEEGRLWHRIDRSLPARRHRRGAPPPGDRPPARQGHRHSRSAGHPRPPHVQTASRTCASSSTGCSGWPILAEPGMRDAYSSNRSPTGLRRRSRPTISQSGGRAGPASRG